MRSELLLDAGEFWDRLKEDLSTASESAYIQTFTFEGDRVGVGLGRALERCPARDRRLLIDGYSLLYHSDRLIPGPALLDRRFRREVALTRRWVNRLREGGAGVRFGNPLGPSPIRLVRRNHKKIAVFDDRVVYLGGINFSDHNFAWHDMMFRIESPELARRLADDFRSSWAGTPRMWDAAVDHLRVVSLNGRGNREQLRPVFDAIEGARRSIDVVSAYLSHPFTRYLTEAVGRGVRVRVLTPAENNKSNLARHVLESAHRGGFEVLRYPGGMSHMKAMTIDGELLIAGSSNFDFMSYHILEEHVVMTRDRGIIQAFDDRVWRPDTRGVVPAESRSSIGTRLGHLVVRVAAAVAACLALPARQESLSVDRLTRVTATLVLALLMAAGAPQGAASQTAVGINEIKLFDVVPTHVAPERVRPAWVVGDVPDTVWVLVETAIAEDDEDRMKGMLIEAEEHARVATVGYEQNIGRRFALAAVLGMRADREGGRTKVRAASEMHDELQVVLELDPDHARARFMMGRLHAGVRRMNRVTRWLATNLLGGSTLKQATWELAEENLAFAEAQAPEVPDHHLQLARLFRDTDRPELALAEVEHVLGMAAVSPMELAAYDEALALQAEWQEG